MTMVPGMLLILCLATALAAPPEISLTIHRTVDEDQGLNETLNATHDMIILEASDVLDNNSTFVNGTETGDEEHEEDHTSSRLARETNITKEEDGTLLVQLPKVDNSSTDIHVGTGKTVVNQVSGELAVESKGGWEVRLQTAVITEREGRQKRTDRITRILIYDTYSSRHTMSSTTSPV